MNPNDKNFDLGEECAKAYIDELNKLLPSSAIPPTNSIYAYYRLLANYYKQKKNVTSKFIHILEERRKTVINADQNKIFISIRAAKLEIICIEYEL